MPKTQIAWLIIFAGIVAALFYWYEVRPGQLRASCAEESDEDIHKIIDLNKWKGEDRRGNITIEQGQLLDEIWETNYKQCLRRKGLV